MNKSHTEMLRTILGKLENLQKQLLSTHKNSLAIEHIEAAKVAVLKALA